MAKYDRLLELVHEHCTIEQIKETLRPALGNKDVKLSADDKEELVYKNVRQALNSHSIDVEKIYDLLREAEENGPQHIFYLRCPSKDVVDKLTLEHARRMLLGTNEPSDPRLEVKRNDYIVADVRAWGRRKPLDWAVKIYGHEVREIATGEVIRESAQRILKVFTQEEFRYVLLARWSAPDLLELRVPRDSSVQRIDHWKRILEQHMRNVVPFDRFRPWSLAGISRTLFDEQAKHQKMYRLGDAKLEDPNHNLITFESFVPDSDLFGGLAAQKAAKDLLELDSKYKHQRVLWLKQEDQGVTSEISTLLGFRAENEVVFSRHQNSRGIDYVTGQLRAFSKR